MLGECDQFIVIGVGDVHQYKLRVKIPSEQRTHIARRDTSHGHPIVARIITGVNLEREIVFNREFNASRPTPIAEAEPRCFVNRFRRFCEHSVQRSSRLSIAPFRPVERSVVSMLRFYSDRTRGVFGKDRIHRGLEGSEVVDVNARFSVDSTRIHLSVTECRPREIVEEKIGTGGIRGTLPTEIICLNMVKIRDVV